MKKTLYLLLGLAAAMTAFVSCDDEEFLKEKPKTIYTEETAFEKSSQVDAALVNAYAKFGRMNTYSLPFPFGAPVEGSANFLHGDGSDVLGDPHGKQGVAVSFSNYWNLRTDNGNFLTTWNSLYQLAAYANLAMKGLDMVSGVSDSDAAYLTAQARFFRGWAYLRLAEMFGGVPIVEEYSEDLKFDYGRSSREDTYSFAIQDLEAASAGLPEVPAASGRVSKGVADHFLAEAYLGRGIETENASDYDKAIAAADKVIAAHPLMTERFGSRSLNGTQPAGIPDNGVPRYRPDFNVYSDLFTIGNYSHASGNTESLMIYEQPTYDDVSIYGGYMIPFAVTCSSVFRDLTWNAEKADEAKNAGATGGPWMGNIDGMRYPGQQLGIYLTGSWGIITSMDYSDVDVWQGDFAADDRNAQVNRYTPVVMDQKSPYYGQVVKKEWLSDPASLARVSGKITTFDIWGWNLDHSAFAGVFFCYQYGRDWYIARSAETYLLRAEAYLRKGDKSKAAADINAVRSRSHATKLYSADQVSLYTILDERARELSWEEMRWPTLLRMGGHGQNEIMHTQLENHSLGTEDEPTFKGQKFPDWTLFPIPYSVINLNKDAVLEQNPGWK